MDEVAAVENPCAGEGGCEGATALVSGQVQVGVSVSGLIELN